MLSSVHVLDQTTPHPASVPKMVDIRVGPMSLSGSDHLHSQHLHLGPFLIPDSAFYAFMIPAYPFGILHIKER
eukprot:1146111-Pelagomonas_calceolata.AAC.4